MYSRFIFMYLIVLSKRIYKTKLKLIYKKQLAGIGQSGQLFKVNGERLISYLQPLISISTPAHQYNYRYKLFR
jgi:hypothetical protein